VSQATQVPSNGYSAHATHGDFYRIFSGKMDRLYLLALLLTAGAGEAEQCLVAGIGDSAEQLFEAAWDTVHLSKVRFNAVSTDYQRLAGSSSVRV
jgi:hypothetical protein